MVWVIAKPIIEPFPRNGLRIDAHMLCFLAKYYIIKINNILYPGQHRPVTCSGKDVVRGEGCEPATDRHRFSHFSHLKTAINGRVSDLYLLNHLHSTGPCVRESRSMCGCTEYLCVLVTRMTGRTMGGGASKVSVCVRHKKPPSKNRV